MLTAHLGALFGNGPSPFLEIKLPFLGAASLYRRVQNIKAGRGGPKVTRHNHLFRGLFRCGLCNRPMSPERQKGRVYYRCQGSDCPTKTVREDVLDSQIWEALAHLEIPEADATKLIAKWNAGLSETATDDQRRSLQLRIDASEQSLLRAADLLIAGTLDNATYLAKKRDTELMLASLREELDDLPDIEEIRTHQVKFIELLKTLTQLYGSLKPAEKREFIENTFSNRKVIGKKVELEPYDWLQEPQFALSVSVGDPTGNRTPISRMKT